MKKIINQLFKQAIVQAFGKDHANTDPLIQRSMRAEFGDYQANFAMRLAKQVGMKPIDVAHNVIKNINDPLFLKLEPSGPGFINIFLNDQAIANLLLPLVHDERLQILRATHPETVVVDYANANVAKEMHVGHLRSIVIGDAIVRILEFLGHHVIRQSHLGDWGTQFGMLIEYLLESGKDPLSYSVSELDPLYKESKARFDASEEFAERARKRVVALQQGDEATLAIWKMLVKNSLQYFQQIYDKLDVLVTEEDARGESFYNFMLDDVVSELMQLGIAHEDDGAIVVLLDEWKDQDGKFIPNIIRKRDGGYLYATTDLATAKYRMNELGATRVIYLTDARQKQHFAMLFATLRKAGWMKPGARFEHIPFGAILGADNKPFKTRSGESIKLIALLNEAEDRAKIIAKNKNPHLADADLTHIAHSIGIGALKYADLRADKIKDYVFDWDKLLSFDGNTAPYLQNAYVRILSLFKKAELDVNNVTYDTLMIHHPHEHALALQLLAFEDVLYMVSDTLSLHALCDYLYELASCYHRFYEECPILTSDVDVRANRLLLSALTAKTLKLGLSLLGINTITRM